MRRDRRLSRSPGRWARVLSLFGTPTRPRAGPDGEQLWLGLLGNITVALLLAALGGLLARVCRGIAR